MRRPRERCLVLALTSCDCNGPLRVFVRHAREGVEGARLLPSVTSQERPVEHRQHAMRVGNWMVLKALCVCTCRQFPELSLCAARVDVVDFALESNGGD